MRDKIWKWVISKQPEGSILPRWAKAIRVILHPINTLFWMVCRYGLQVRYNPLCDEWNIYGVRYSGSVLRVLSMAEGGVYKITRDGDVVIFMHVDNER